MEIHPTCFESDTNSMGTKKEKIYEEGEVTDSEPSGSPQSVSSSDSEFNDGYDENYMGDDEDRERLNSLSEKERETEIYKRIEQRDVLRRRWEIERKLKLAHRSKKVTDKCNVLNKNKKPSSLEGSINFTPGNDNAGPEIDGRCIGSDSFDYRNKNSESIGCIHFDKPQYLDHKERSKERKKNVEMNRTDDKRSNAMARLRAEREGKAKREEHGIKGPADSVPEEENELKSLSTCKSAVKLRASEIYSDDSFSSDGEDIEKQQSNIIRSISSREGSILHDECKSETEKKLISSREELNKLRISRFKIERFVNLPTFESTVKNTFVRISIGNSGQKPVYRVAEVVGVVQTAKIYNLGQTRTNKGLRLKHGNQERVFRLEFISNQEFTESEFKKWRDICVQQNVAMPAVDLIEKKRTDIEVAINYEFNEEDIKKIIEEKNRFRSRPTNYAMKKTCLMKERDAALIRGDYELAQDLGHQVEELESRASELDKKRSSSIRSISYINDRNRKRNVEGAEKAILEEAKANKGQKISDPFTRRITQPRMGFKIQDNRFIDNADNLSIKESPTSSKVQRIEPELQFSKNVNEYSLYSLHDFDIDLDVCMPVNVMNISTKPQEKVIASSSKRSLNLDDYKKKRGLI